jgi:hypothetical protein
MNLLGCVLCQIDVQSASLLVPLAQAAIISAPIVFRKEIKRGIRRARGQDPGDEAVVDAEALSEEWMPGELDGDPTGVDQAGSTDERRS